MPKNQDLQTHWTRMNPVNTILVPAFFCLIACSETPPPIAKELPGDSSEINTPWDGTYYGSQGDYFLNKASGEPLVINGQKVPVPGSTFIFELNGLDVQVYQRADDDTMENGFGYYIGTCLETAQSESSAQLSCTCKEQSSSTTSEPPFVLSINLVDGSMVCPGILVPNFMLRYLLNPLMQDRSSQTLSLHPSRVFGRMIAPEMSKGIWTQSIFLN
jgi:hypothetical protein